MKYSHLVKYLSLAILLFFACKQNKKSKVPIGWSYSGNDGPDKWGELCSEYSKCKKGKSQSPIEIDSINFKKLHQIEFDYKTSKLKIAHNQHMHDIIDNGHSIQVTVEEGSTLKIKGKEYNLIQFHFHTPSEHIINNEQDPMEMHMVHQSKDGSLAVLSIIFKEGKTENENIAKIVDHIPNEKGVLNEIHDVELELNFGVKNQGKYAYQYTGSLTTPPCSEGVEWIVLNQKVEVTKEQIKAFHDKMGANNRPVQKRNKRKTKDYELQLQQN
jgi:carbonic anhydrase